MAVYEYLFPETSANKLSEIEYQANMKFYEFYMLMIISLMFLRCCEALPQLLFWVCLGIVLLEIGFAGLTLLDVWSGTREGGCAVFLSSYLCRVCIAQLVLVCITYLCLKDYAYLGDLDDAPRKYFKRILLYRPAPRVVLVWFPLAFITAFSVDLCGNYESMTRFLQTAAIILCYYSLIKIRFSVFYYLYNDLSRIRPLLQESQSIAVMCKYANNNIYVTDEVDNMDRKLSTKCQFGEPFIVFCKGMERSFAHRKLYYVYFGKDASILRTRPLSHCIAALKRNLSSNYANFNDNLTYDERVLTFPTQQFKNIEKSRFYVYYLNHACRMSGDVNALMIYSNLQKYIENSTVESALMLLIFTETSPAFNYV
mmetsp:Transcript_20809/g.69464  ORF Transcript_20809/g.69464 Transcript_20809/m.69464 type:complete len:369 (-) Transcript_20809:316-1422(-)